MSKFVFLFAAIALLHVVSGFAPCNCGCGSVYPIGGYSGYLGGLGSSSYLGGAALPAYGGLYGSGLYGGSLIGSGIGCGAYTYPGRVGLSCTPVTSCTTGTCARPVTVCRQAWQTYPCTSCSTGLSCAPTCSC